MPGGDQTGPLGRGRMSGRAAGYCAGFGMPGYANPTPGRCFGMGFGGGRGFGGRGGGGHGWRHMYYATGLPGWALFSGYTAPNGNQAPDQKPDPEMEKQALAHQAAMMQAELDAIRQRLSELETNSEKE